MGIAFVASHWAKIEHTLSLAYTVLLSGQEPAAFEAYHDIFDMKLRRTMFKAAARGAKLPKELAAEADAKRRGVLRRREMRLCMNMGGN
jgi:hypothetical protein